MFENAISFKTPNGRFEGVYILLKRGVIVYIGTSRTMFTRIAAHRLPYCAKDFDEVQIIWISGKERKRLEFDLIYKHLPPLNVGKVDIFIDDAKGEINWLELRDVDVAKKYKLSRERVRQVREFLNHPKCKYQNKSVNFLKFCKLFSKHRSVKFSECKNFTLHAQSIKRWCKELQIHLEDDRPSLRGSPYKYPWKSVNWDLPDRFISECFGVHQHSVWRARQKHNNGHACKYSIQGLSDESKTKLRNELSVLMDAERVKLSTFQGLVLQNTPSVLP